MSPETAAASHGSLPQRRKVPKLGRSRHLSALAHAHMHTVPLVLCDSSIAWQVEGGEYTLLPHLLVSGALCLADYLHVEWHPNAIAATSASSNETQLLEGLSLRQAMQLVLKGCARPPTAVSHEGLRQKEYMRYAMGCQGGRKPS